jgi:2-iminobutanoate/2-iminopropanoate deaminase
MHRAITTEAAPKAIGPYSQAICSGPFVFCSGQIGLDPASGNLVVPRPGEVAAPAAVQAARCIENLRAVLEAAECGLGDVVRTTIYLTDLADFAAVNDVYARYFQAPFPARVTIQVSALPRGAAVEIDATAVKSA